MVTVKEAREILLQNSRPLLPVLVDLSQSAGLVLQADVFAGCDVPIFDNSAMDGYAVCLDDNIEFYRVIEMVAAGNTAEKTLEKGEAARIFTGAPVPKGANVVVPQELVLLDGKQISFNRENLKPLQNIRFRGSQCKTGDLLLKAYETLNAGKIALLASAGIGQVSVIPKPRLGIITTGNELIGLNEKPAAGQIFNSNAPALNAALNEDGINDINISHIYDDFNVLKEAIRLELLKTDLLILTGGVSAGDYDFVRPALLQNGVEELFYKVYQKPGKPLWIGKTERNWVVALPGNPAAVLTCYYIYVRPLIKILMGKKQDFNEIEKAVLINHYSKKGELTHFLKAVYGKGEVRICDGQESFNLMPFAEANVLVEMPSEINLLSPGDTVKVHLI